MFPDLPTAKFHWISYKKVESTMAILHMRKPVVYASLVFLITGGFLVIRMLVNDDLNSAYGKVNETGIMREEGKLVEYSDSGNFYLKIAKHDQKTAFRQFDSDRVYQIEGAPERSLTQQEQEHLSSVKEVASAYLKTQMKEGTFVGGGYRWVSDGVEYDLSFKDYSKGIMNKVTLFQKLESPEVIRRSESHDTSVVNLILTLRGRLSKYAIFLDHLVKVILPVDPHVTLTVVYFSDNVMKTAENMTRLALSSFPSTKWVFVPVEKGPFSRGRGLHLGAQSIKYSTPQGSSKIVFFCDVDVLMQPEFFGRCRSNAILGRQVYYPVLFSQYNPRLVHLLHDQSIPHTGDQLVINEQAGFWREFGYGMACMYISDYETADGFPDIDTWGGEDVVLYEKFLSLDHIRVEADGLTSCQRVPEYAYLDGYCFISGVETCSATDYKIGCDGPDCSLCVLDTSICLPKPVCSDANGVCVKNLAKCDRLINERHCHGDGCACCKDGCQRQPKCKEVGGYCLLKNQTQLCDGTQFNLGCLGTDCFCCVPDTRICIEKEGCLERNGYCLKQGGWTTCNREIDSYFCLGDKCACCRETECVRSSQCRNMGGYCYRQKADPSKQHICNGLMVSGGCGDSNCICCVPYSG